MNWTAISAVSELFGLIAVVVSLIYLAAQIKTQTREFRLAAIHDVSVTIMESYSAVQDPSMADVWVRGSKDFDALNETEQVQMIGFMQRSFRALEDAFYQAKDDRLDPRFWNGIIRYYGSLLSAPGVARVWEIRKSTYSEDFQKFIESIQRTDYTLK